MAVRALSRVQCLVTDLFFFLVYMININYITTSLKSWCILLCKSLSGISSLAKTKEKIGSRRSGRHLCVWTCCSGPIAVCLSFPAHTWSAVTFAPLIKWHHGIMLRAIWLQMKSQIKRSSSSNDWYVIAALMMSTSWSTPPPYPEMLHFLSPSHPPPLPAQFSPLCNPTDNQWQCPF